MNKSEFTPSWKAANKSLSSTSSTLRAFLLKRVINNRRLSFFPCSMVNKLDKERLCLCPPNEIINKQLAQLFKRTYRIRGYFAEPDSCQTFKGGREGSTHDFIRDPLKVHCCLECCNVIERVTCPIIRVQGR